MITSVIEGIRVAGISSAIPQKKVNSEDYIDIFGGDTVRKVIETTGVVSTYHSIEKQTASDLAYVAAKNLIEKKNVDPKEIGILIFVGAHHDYICPATAFVLQKRLNISTDAIVFDVNLGCSGFVYGMHTGASLLKNSNATKALILFGDSSSRVVSEKDSSRMLFGDSGAALLLEKGKEISNNMKFGFKSDGNRYNDIYIPAGGYRHPIGSRKLHKEEDGWERSDYHSHMDGTDVFVFSVTDVPEMVRDFMKENALSVDNIDMLFMHQPNQFIIKNIIKKLKFPADKVPITINKFGNTSSVSIPLTMGDVYGDCPTSVKRVMLIGFGIGLSWGVSSLDIDTDVIVPVVQSDDYYEDGLL